MRYAKGSLVISADRDIPLLLEVRNSKFISRRQLFELLQTEDNPLNPKTYTCRLQRLLRADFIRLLEGTGWHGSAIYSITPRGLMELESHGELAIALHSGTLHMPHPLHVYHALELTDIRLKLRRSSLLVDWRPEIEIASCNMVSGVFRKDYDALVSLDIGGATYQFGLEYERTLKSARRYARVRTALDAERNVDSVLYLAASPKMAVILAYYLTPCSRPLAFAAARQFCQQLLATPVIVEVNAPPVTLDYFLVRAGEVMLASSRAR
jgi:hypothetical protein